MKQLDGRDISAKQAAQQITYQFGNMWTAMGDGEIAQAINMKKPTENQMVKLREQLQKMDVRLRKICGMK